MAKVKMINSLGNAMWVTEEKVEEYKAAGHKLAAPVVPATKPTEDEEEEEKEVKGLVKELKEEKKKSKRK